MKAPSIIAYSTDSAVADHLRDFAAVHRWRLQEVKTPAGLRTALAMPRPIVVLWEIDAVSSDAAADAALADIHRSFPDVPIVVVSPSKLSDDDRPAWSAARLNLGARHILFPPWTKLVLEDLAGGLLAASIRRITGKDPPPPMPRGDAAIDLAEGVYDDED